MKGVFWEVFYSCRALSPAECVNFFLYVFIDIPNDTLYCKEFITSNFTASKDQHFGMSKAVYGLTSLAQEKISNWLNMLKNFLCVQVSNAILSFLLSNAL